MEDIGRLTMMTLTKEELDVLIQAQATKMVEQQALVERQIQEPATSAFSRGILDDRLLKHYTLLTIEEYNGMTDPDDHLAKFVNTTTFHQYTDGVKYLVFLMTLSGSAQRWFKRLPNGSIHSFKDFRAAFLHQFASSRRYQKTSVNLFALKQGTKEALTTYIKCFNQVSMDIPSVSSEILVNAFAQGFTEGEFFSSLIRRSSKDFDHLLRRATEYKNVEKAQAVKRKEAPVEPVVAPERRPPSSHQPPKGPEAGEAQQH
ncbi:uncharacterized protein LOC122048094 [Zingiber officinale]|uniref:uncharacterized protein LOC122048094 n=1 Tax=Zingiber officinale TaxID=94328 RepID=UPI001C4C0F3E|nr:uncharacterized protein LOC122048094 [Zingiber officinale]